MNTYKDTYAMNKPFAVTLASSSSGNATLFSDGSTHILLDAGLSGRALHGALACFSLTAGDLSAVLVSHEHGDHVGGLPYIPKHVPVYASFGTAARLSGHVTPIASGSPFSVNDVQVTFFATPHDTGDSVGFLLEDGSGKSMALVTDLGHMPVDVLSVIATVPVLFFETNYDQNMLMLGHYPYYLKRRIAGTRGHLSNDKCADTALHCVTKGLRQLTLMHLSKENNTPELAYAATCERLEDGGVRVGRDVLLQVAPRVGLSQRVWL